MRRRQALLLCGTGVATALWPSAPRAGTDPKLAPLQRGVGLGLFSEDPLWSYGELLREIRDLGASHVSLTIAYYQEHAASTSIYLHPRFSAPDFALVRTLREARALGLKTLVFPIVRLDHPRS